LFGIGVFLSSSRIIVYVPETGAQSNSEMPAWIENFILKGDLRLRNEYINNDPGFDNNRQRLRFRFGGKTKVNDKVKLSFGLATGSSDNPRSTNQTLEQEFQSKEIWLDYAFVDYEPFEWINFIGGKFKSPFFHTDMLWDGDIRWDGFAVKMHHEVIPDHTLYLTGGFFPIDDRPAGKDINLYAGQIGTKSKIGANSIHIKTGLALYGFSDIKGISAASLAESPGTNTITPGGLVANDFVTINPNAKIYFSDVVGHRGVGLLGEYAHNLEASTLNDGWRGGIWFGQYKVKQPRDWKLLVQYTRLERDVFFDSFPDSDFNFAGTDGKGWEIIFNYGLAENVFIGIDYYITEKISAPRADQDILQTDIIFKF
jgi:hypothetical protein